ncbi:MAG: hypothetical protein QOH26_1107, partial [Actinomycetota bacterium]|nr:hypothetical protein [Actinomycetota bacterium]
DAYLTFGYVPTPMTFYEGILSVPPGHVVVVEPGKEPQVSEYWLPPLVAPGRDARIEMSLGDAAGEVRRLLEESVERRLISDVPLGAFLSGGIDSSAIVGIMASKLDRPVSTFTIGFTDEHGFDERPYARTIAERFSTDHHEFVVEPKAVDLIERLVWHHDQPFGDSSAVPTFLLSELTRTEVTVALSGDGGDELFAGYERFAAALALARYRRVPRKLRGALEAAVDRGRPETLGGRVGSLQRFTRRADLDTLEAYRSWVAFAPDETLRALLPGGSDWALAQYRSTWARSAGAETLDRLQDLNIRTYLVDDLLVKADRMSMAHALEVRSPFLDPALADFALRLPPSARLRGPVLKRVLKHALRDLLPRQILHRRKKGFGVPLDRWFREDLKSFMEAKLGSPNASIRSHLVPAELDRLLAEHDRRTANHGQLLWALLTLEVFLERQAW